MAIVKNNFPPVLSGFEHINRYWDRRHHCIAAKILPGEYYITREDEYIVTVLGSCVAVCMRDNISGMGGMNHFMLPIHNSYSHHKIHAGDTSAAARYGNYAMELLINSLLGYGVKRENLEVKLFGGGSVMRNITNVGEHNIAFIKDYVENEHLTVLAENLGDIFPRKVMYHPLSGRAKMKKLRSMHNDTVIQRESTYKYHIEEKEIEGDIELF